MRRFLLALLLAAGACSDTVAPRRAPEVQISRAAITDSEAIRAALLTEQERWKRERRERQLDTVDPGELIEHVNRLGQPEIERGADVAKIFQQGESMFERRFTLAEGVGYGKEPLRGLSRVQREILGPDAVSCVECHHRGGDDGAGELHQRAWLKGDGRMLSSAEPRVAPHLSGLGPIQLLAAEMTSELQARRDAILANPGDSKRFELSAKGVDFGVLLVTDAGMDFSQVRGVDRDLIVKPFGWKGSHATLRKFVRDALPEHIGLEPTPLDAGPTFELAELQPWLHDEDGDGVPGELHEGQLTSMAVYLALLDVPQVRPPRSAELREAWTRGGAVFERLGCAGCHRPTLALNGTKWTERGEQRDAGVTIDLIADVQVHPALEQRDYAKRLEVALFSDLKRHDLGAGLATRETPGGALEPQMFLTRPLWGLGTRGNAYLHDGRARTIDAAILLHGGEAQDSRDAFAKADESDRAALRVYLLSLRRQPMARLLP